MKGYQKLCLKFFQSLFNNEKYIVSSIGLLLIASISFAHPKLKPIAKPAQYELQKILTGINLPCKIVYDNLAAIPYEGIKVMSHQVNFQKISDL